MAFKENKFIKILFLDSKALKKFSLLKKKKKITTQYQGYQRYELLII